MVVIAEGSPAAAYSAQKAVPYGAYTKILVRDLLIAINPTIQSTAN
jgi:hypothetical protein